MADVLRQAGDLSGKVIVTCSLPMDTGNAKLIVANISSGAEELAKKVPQTLPALVPQPTHARADFTSVREKSCPLNKSGSPLDFASA